MIDDETGASDAEKSVPENVSEESSDSVGNDISDEVSDSEFSAQDEGEDLALSKSEERREQRRRRRVLEGLANAFELSDEEALKAFEMVDELLPDANRMSTAQHVGDRLEHALEEMRSRHPRLLFNRPARTPIDVTDPKKFFAENEALAGLFDSEEGLLRALMVNDRAMSGMHRWMAEHEAVRGMILSELVRRSTLVEQWRHLLPKYMLPIYSMIHASGAKAGELRPDKKLFNRIRDAIVEWSCGSVSRETLMGAARRTEDEFLSVLKDEDQAGEPVSESFDACRQRLSFALEEARLDVEELVAMEADAEDVSAAESKVRRLIMALGLDGGIDGNGRLVFSSVESFAERSRAVAPSRRNDNRTDLDEAHDGVKDAYENVADVDEIELAEGVPDTGGDESTEDRSVSDIDASAPADSVEDDDGVKGGVKGDVDKGHDEGFGPDIPDDLFGTEPGVDPEDETPAEDENEDTSGVSAPMEDGDTEAGTDEVSDVLPVEPVSIPPAPVGEEHTVFSPERLEDWPTNISEVQALVPSLPRSTGLSRSTGSDPFKMWTPLPDKTDFCFVGFRRHPDLSAREGIEGPIEPADLSRMEMGEGKWRGLIRDTFSPVLGAGHPLMLPPHSSLAWYGRKLGWSEADVRSLTAFGSPARPESITPKGDVKKLLDALRGVARLRMDELARSVNGHFLSDTQRGEERRKEASEDLARWWLFVLVARHRQAEFDMLLPGGFFHGVHGPDFVVDAEGKAYFGKTGNASHLGLWSIEMRRRIDQAGPKAKPEDLGIGEPYSGPRRMTA